MNTTFILHGGQTFIESKDNELFFKQFTSYVDKEEVRILLCFWARPKEEWNKLFQRDSAKIIEQSNKKLDLCIVADPEDLYKKLVGSDVLYVSGGEAELIEPYLPRLSHLGNALKGKVYLGSSMGAFIVSKNYVLSMSYQDISKAHEGLGIVQLNTLCHWNVEKAKDKKIQILKEKDSQTPILLLDEEKFSTIII